MKIPSQGLLVADAGPLIILAKCALLDLLKTLFEQIHVPQAVLDEVLGRGTWAETPLLRKWILQTHVHAAIEEDWVQDMRLELDEGEIQAMVLAKQLNALVLIDEAHGRRIAASASLKLIGTLGVLLIAKKQGLIKAIRPITRQMMQEGYALSASVVEFVLQQAGESVVELHTLKDDH
jgi:predicted nucleic acid-binding protein